MKQKITLMEADKVDYITNDKGVVVKLIPREDCKVVHVDNSTRDFLRKHVDFKQPKASSEHEEE